MLCINAVTSHELQCYNMSLTMMASNNHHLNSLYTQDIPPSLASQPAKLSAFRIEPGKYWQVNLIPFEYSLIPTSLICLKIQNQCGC